ncbi:MAG: M28 family peptidase [Rubricoccaceae bacterium]
MSRLLLALLAALFVSACAPAAPPAVPPAPAPPAAEAPDVRDNPFDVAALLEDLRTLSSPAMEGRRMGTPGHARAQAYLRQRFAEVGLEPLGDSLGVPFRYVPRGGTAEEDGTNFVGIVRGTESGGPYLLVLAHYDHLGIRNGQIYHGADDNASGTAALITLAGHLRRNPPRHSVIIAALDAEEVGLQGARFMAANPPVPLDEVALVINMDMIGRSETGELYAAGTYHYPFLRPHVEAVAAEAPIRLLMGHDSPDLPPGDDWTMSSDHGPFHQRGVPFIYFGVEDHEGYHQPSDTYENITPFFYIGAVETVIAFVERADRHLAAIHAARRAQTRP